MTEDEIFLSPMLTIEDAVNCRVVLKSLCPKGKIVEKYSKSVTLRVVSHNEVGLIANVNCVIVTPLCLLQMQSIHRNPLLFDVGTYANLFLFKRKIALINVSKQEEKRLTHLIKMMGGEIVFLMDKKVNVIVTGLDNELIDPNFRPNKKATVVRSAWLDALINSDVFLDPMRFRATPSHVPEPTIPKKKPMKSLRAELKSIKAANPGDVLRQREKAHDIRLFLPTTSSPRPSRSVDEPSSPEAPPSQIEEVIRMIENSESDSDDVIEFTHPISSLCHDIMSFTASRPVETAPVAVDTESLLEFTQRPAPELVMEVGYGHSEVIDDQSDTEDPLLYLF